MQALLSYLPEDAVLKAKGWVSCAYYLKLPVFFYEIEDKTVCFNSCLVSTVISV